MFLDDLTVFIISTGEDTYDECMKSLKSQKYSFRIEHIRDVYPMSKAFQTMPDCSTTRYFIQVDADMILKPFAVSKLYEAAKRSGFFTPIIHGQLYEEGFGVGGSVRLWKKHLFRYFSFRDRRTVDRDLFRRIRIFGFRKKNLNEVLGIHRPRHSEFSNYLKTKSDIEKWRFLRRKPALYALKTLDQSWKHYPQSEYNLLGAMMGALTGWRRVVRSKNIDIEKERFKRLKMLFGIDGCSTYALKIDQIDYHHLAQHFFKAYMDRTDDMTSAKRSLCNSVIQIFGRNKDTTDSQEIIDLYEIALL